MILLGLISYKIECLKPTGDKKSERMLKIKTTLQHGGGAGGGGCRLHQNHAFKRPMAAPPL